MSADNFLALVKEGKGKWVGYHCCASRHYRFADCYACLGVKAFETTTELKALHEAQRVERQSYLEYGYIFVDKKRLTKKEKLFLCPCEINRFMEANK